MASMADLRKEIEAQGSEINKLEDEVNDHKHTVDALTEQLDEFGEKYRGASVEAINLRTDIDNANAKARKAESQWSSIVLALEIANDRLRRAMTDLIINMSDAGRVGMIKRRRFDPDNGYIADVPREG